MSVLQRSEQIRGTFDEILQNLLTLVKVRRNCVDCSIGSFESHTKFWNTTEIILLSRFVFADRGCEVAQVQVLEGEATLHAHLQSAPSYAVRSLLLAKQQGCHRFFTETRRL